MNVLNDEMRKAIVTEYQNSTVTKLSMKYHISTDRIKQTLIENGIEIRVPTKSTTESNYSVRNMDCC